MIQLLIFQEDEEHISSIFHHMAVSINGGVPPVILLICSNGIFPVPKANQRAWGSSYGCFHSHGGTPKSSTLINQPAIGVPPWPWKASYFIHISEFLFRPVWIFVGFWVFAPPRPPLSSRCLLAMSAMSRGIRWIELFSNSQLECYQHKNWSLTCEVNCDL